MNQEYEFRQVFLPYCINRLQDGRYIVLNRLYKPLGIHSRDWVVYETHPSAVKITGLTAAAAKKISFRGDDALDRIYLYNDGCKPTISKETMDAYSKRLSVLAALVVG